MEEAVLTFNELWRYVIAGQAIIVGCLYLHAAFIDFIMLRSAVGEARFIYKGRIATFIAIGAIMAVSAQAQIALVELGITIRQPLLQFAVIGFFLGWGFAARRHYRADSSAISAP